MATDTADEVGGVDDEALFSALAHKRRRYTLHYLRQQSEPVPVQELAEQVAAWENEKPVAQLTSQERKRVYVALYQSHLSTMDDEGLVNYDEDAGTVKLTEPMDSVNLFLEVVDEKDIPWTRYYLGLIAANTLFLGLVWTEIPPFGEFPALAAGGIILIAFAVSVLAQAYSQSRVHIGDDGPPPELR